MGLDEDAKVFEKFVAENVKRIREEKGKSQQWLSLEIGHKSTTIISQAEAGINNKHFNINQLYKIAKALDVDICEFFKIQQT